MKCVLAILCLSPSFSRSIFCSSPLSLASELVSIRLSLRLRARRLPWGWWEGWRRELRVFLSDFLLRCAVGWPEAPPSWRTAPPQRAPSWCQHSSHISRLPASWCLTISGWFPDLAYICVNSSFIKCTLVVASEWNSIFCWVSH